MIGSASFAELARTVPTAFTRKRLLPLPHLVTFLINGPRAGLQPELAAFFDHALESDRVQAPTKSAFCQARSQLRPTAIRTLVIASGQALLRHCEAERWHGLRVLALDGSTLRTAESPECAEYFGGMQPRAGDFCPIARVSALFDVARDSFVDAVLGKYSDDERSLALDHLDQLGPTDLVVMDRGYPSRNLLAEFSRRGAFWCVRMTTSWKVVKRFARSDRIDALVDLGTPESPLPSRLLRVVLPNGSVFILATNVLDPAFSPSAFADLYHGRWRIEKAFKLIKARLQAENRGTATYRRKGFLRHLGPHQLRRRPGVGGPSRGGFPFLAGTQRNRMARSAQPHIGAKKPPPSPRALAAADRFRCHPFQADHPASISLCPRTYPTRSDGQTN